MNYFAALFANKCPHCRQGDLFCKNTLFRKGSMEMHKNCPVCHQLIEIEPGFYYGTGYVSYALTVAFTVSTFVAWWVIVGMGLYDNRLFWWMGFNAIALIALMPWFMKISRTIWLSLFVRYDADWRTENLLQIESTVA